MIKLYNTMTREKEEFKPLEDGKVKMYVCGPTVYNYIHIGNARSVVAFDTIRKYLEYRGFEVDYISNFTDVDDKIINAAREAGIDIKDLTDNFIDAFFKDVASLGVKKANQHPRVMDFMDEILGFVSELITKGFAYESDGDVYFRVRKFPNYGALAGKNLDELEEGASGRVSADSLKEDPLDFALWKSASDDEPAWESPWGLGRPGWHIECSVMATELLGDTIDIHGGGQDLEFPHHTNEIAQSESKTGKTFANYWLHNGFVTTATGEKMSKSLGNFKTVHDMLDIVDPQVLRFFLTTTHYRRPLLFSDSSIQDAENNFAKIKTAYENMEFDLSKGNSVQNEKEIDHFRKIFTEAMDDDFNIANGLTVFYDFIRFVNSGNASLAALAFFDEVLTILGLEFTSPGLLDSDIDAKIEERELARKNRDFALADKIRDELREEGIILEDTKEGVRWRRG
ncbi:cysteine--tRNA ligase [Streptococcaceae bacterium ESL0687]|nr:cysteine--tRNA ligase [Streptococcaceae bacterium ESL0687]